jgi:hypothetical protein
MSYQLRLISLRCNKAQEGDGDEIYLKLNGDIIFTWDKVGYKFVDKLIDDSHMVAFDFRQGKVNLATGWHENEAYASDDFIFELDAPAIVELWESDEHEFLRGDNDQLGGYVMDASHASKGETMVMFNLRGAEYELRFHVSQ